MQPCMYRVLKAWGPPFKVSSGKYLFGKKHLLRKLLQIRVSPSNVNPGICSGFSWLAGSDTDKPIRFDGRS